VRVSGQPELPEVDPLPPPPRQASCAWCSRPAMVELVVRLASFTTNHHGQRVKKRDEVRAGACAACARRLRERYGG
jgi:hypothetical protein